MKRSKILLCAVLAALLLVSAVAVTSCEEGEAVTGISSVEVKGGEVTLKATLEESYASDHSKDTLYILALSEMQADGSLKGATVVAEAKAKKSMTFKFSLTDELGGSRIAAAFVLAEKKGDKYSALTDFAYITNPESVATRNNSPASTSSIKGLTSNDPMGSAAVGAEHIVVVADMAKLIVEDYAPEAIRFNYENVTYFYDEGEVALLDKAIKEAELSGMRVYIRTVQTKKSSSAATMILPDVDDAAAVKYIKAFYAFLASRYETSDYIIGDRVNNYTNYCNAGKIEAEEFERLYFFWARMSNNILKSVNSSAKIYVPVDNSWKSDGKNGVIGAQAFLSHLASSAKAGGDYDYAIALNLGSGDDLTALLKDEGYNYSKIGAINLSEFSDFIDKSEMRYKSEKREMIIDGLDLSGVNDSKNRAAYYTLAYYTAAEQGFGAFIYTGSIYGGNYSRSDLYFAFMMCGSSMNSQLAEYTSRFKGAYVPAFENHISNNLKYIQSASTEISEQAARQEKSFPVSLAGFETVGNVKNFQGKMTADGNSWLLEADLSAAHAGAIAASVPAESIVNSGYLGITLDGDAGQTIYVLLKSEGADTAHTLIGECKTQNGKSTYYFDLAEFTKDIDSSGEVTVAICLLPNGDEEVDVEILDLSLYGNSANNTETIIVIVVVAVILAALVALIVLLAVKRKKKAESARDE